MPGKGGCVEEGLKPTPSCVDVDIDQISAYLLGWIVGDGGLYKLSYSGGRMEYRVVVTQKDLSTVTRCLAPLFESLCSMLKLIGSWLREFGIEKFSIYLDDKRHGVYVLEIPSKYRHLFFNIWGLETPCDLY